VSIIRRFLLCCSRPAFVLQGKAGSEGATGTFPLSEPRTTRPQSRLRTTINKQRRRHGECQPNSKRNSRRTDPVKAPKRTGDAKKRRGRPPGSRKSDAAPAPKPVAKAKTKAKGKRASQAGTADELSGVVIDHGRKRKAHAAPDEIAGEDEPQSRKKYVQLEAKTKRISQGLIETWPQVSQQVLEQIVAVIREAKKDIANTQRDERKVIAAHNALNPLVSKLTRQLAASRIPPLAKDVHFNIDKLTERNTQISREVTTARHSRQLLSEQVGIAERFLDKDEANLDQLKKDAKKWRTEWKHQEKNGRVSSLVCSGGWRLTCSRFTLSYKNPCRIRSTATVLTTSACGSQRLLTLPRSMHQMPS
jgi:hypothetical protein